MSKTYLERINKDEKKVAKEELELSAEESSIQIQRDVFGLKSELRIAQRNLENAKSSIPFSSADVLDATADLAACEEAYETLINVQEELFPGKKA